MIYATEIMSNVVSDDLHLDRVEIRRPGEGQAPARRHGAAGRLDGKCARHNGDFYCAALRIVLLSAAVVGAHKDRILRA